MNPNAHFDYTHICRLDKKIHKKNYISFQSD